VIRLYTLSPKTQLEVVLHQQPGDEAGVGISGRAAASSSVTPRYVRARDAYRRDIGFSIFKEGPPTGIAADAVAAIEAAGDPAGPSPSVALQATGLSLLAGSQRVVQPSAHCETVLEGAEQPFYVVPMSFGHYNDDDARTCAAGGAVPCACASATHTLTFALHTSAPVVVEVICKPLSWLAKAAVCDTVSRGKRHDFGASATADGVQIFTLSDGCGARTALLNTGASQTIKYTVSHTGMDNLLTTRGATSTSNSVRNRAGRAPAGSDSVEMVDVVPPRSAQFSCVTVAPMACAANVSRSWGHSMRVAYGRRMEESHEPPVQADGLHAPFRFAT